MGAFRFWGAGFAIGKASLGRLFATGASRPDNGNKNRFCGRGAISILPARSGFRPDSEGDFRRKLSIQWGRAVPYSSDREAARWFKWERSLLPRTSVVAMTRGENLGGESIRISHLLDHHFPIKGLLHQGAIVERRRQLNVNVFFGIDQNPDRFVVGFDLHAAH